jgi:peroxiredoxin
VELALLVARLVLAAVFLLAGVAKLRHPKGSSKALHDFGLPLKLAQPLSLLLSAGEIIVAVALVPVAFAWYGACAALALLSIFVVAIGVTVTQGRKPDCRCFGQLHSSPVGWPTLVRNGMLAAPAGWLVFRGRLHMGPSLPVYLTSAEDNERRVFIVAACVLCFLFLRALRQSERAEPESVASESPAVEAERIVESPGAPEPDRERTPPERAAARRIVATETGLSVGTPAPEFALPSITGQTRSLQSLREQGKTICVLFSSPYCESCQALVPNISGWMRDYEESLNIVVVSRGTAKENLAKLKDFEVSRVLLQQEFEVSEMYGCTATPAAVLVGTDGLIQSQLVVGREEIKQLISSASSQVSK